MLMKQAPCMMAMYIDLQHRHDHYNKHNKNSNKDGREGGVWSWVKNNDIPDKDDYLNFK